MQIQSGKSRRISWTPRFQAPVFALQLLKDISIFAKTGSGDVKKLEEDRDQRWRLRSGDFRALFVVQPDGSLLFTSAGNRKDAY